MVSGPAGFGAAPAHGVFETVLAIDGRLVERRRHSDRLAASVWELYRHRAGPLEWADPAPGWVRVRFDARPVDGGVSVEARSQPVEPRPELGMTEQSTELHAVAVPNGWGRHKWADRAQLDRLAGPGVVPLLVDPMGLVLEATRANVFVVERGRLVTPPANGGILPGVTRRRVLEIARALDMEASEEPVTLERLRAADEVFLTGSIRGIEPVSPTSPRARLIGAELGRCWAAQVAHR
jgi:para-aminobenzoate synthetase/4-amino-4-deoxychorismate lyase